MSCRELGSFWLSWAIAPFTAASISLRLDWLTWAVCAGLGSDPDELQPAAMRPVPSDVAVKARRLMKRLVMDAFLRSWGCPSRSGAMDGRDSEACPCACAATIGNRQRLRRKRRACGRAEKSIRDRLLRREVRSIASGARPKPMGRANASHGELGDLRAVERGVDHQAALGQHIADDGPLCCLGRRRSGGADVDHGHRRIGTGLPAV